MYHHYVWMMLYVAFFVLLVLCYARRMVVLGDDGQNDRIFGLQWSTDRTGGAHETVPRIGPLS